MIRVSEVRFAYHIPGLTAAGNVIVREKDAQMWVTDVHLLVRRKTKPVRDYVLPLSSVEYTIAAEQLDLPFAADDEITEKSPIPGPAPSPVSIIVDSIADDKVRLVKIKGKIVERSGPPKDDELEALTAPRKSVAKLIAEAEGEE